MKTTQTKTNMEKVKKAENVFKDLDKLKFPYSVVKSKCTLVIDSLNNWGYDYFLIIHKSDKKKLESLGYCLSETELIDENGNEIKSYSYEFTLTNQDVSFFEKNKDDFKLVRSNWNGHIYEKNNFGKYYKLKNK